MIWEDEAAANVDSSPERNNKPKVSRIAGHQRLAEKALKKENKVTFFYYSISLYSQLMHVVATTLCVSLRNT